MATSIIRLKDGAELESLPLTVFQANPNTFGMSRSEVSTLGLLGEAIQMGSIIEALDFSLTWISSDTSGYEQRRLRQFFTSREPYVIDDDIFGIYQLEATVLEVNPVDFKTTTVHFAARYSTLVDVYRETIVDEIVPGSELSNWSYPFGVTNPLEDRYAVLQVTIEPSSSTDDEQIWHPGTIIYIDSEVQSTNFDPASYPSVSFCIASQGDHGDWNQIQKRKSIVIDTTRKIMGEGYFDPVATAFGRIPPLRILHGRAMIYRNDSQPVATNPLTQFRIKVELIAAGMVS